MSLPAEHAAVLAGRVARPFDLVELDFPAPHGPVRAWSGIGTLDWDGKAWLGVGTLGGISDIEETSDLKASGVTFTLSGVPANEFAAVDAACSSHYQGRSARVWRGFMDEDGSVLAEPQRTWTGRMDAPEILLKGQTLDVVVSCESILADLDRPRVCRLTDEDQQARFPGDEGLSCVTACQEQEVYWGRESAR